MIMIIIIRTESWVLQFSCLARAVHSERTGRSVQFSSVHFVLYAPIRPAL